MVYYIIYIFPLHFNTTPDYYVPVDNDIHTCTCVHVYMCTCVVVFSNVSILFSDIHVVSETKVIVVTVAHCNAVSLLLCSITVSQC